MPELYHFYTAVVLLAAVYLGVLKRVFEVNFMCLYSTNDCTSLSVKCSDWEQVT